MQNHLKDILQELTERGVLFVVCGGVAVVLHGVERMTLDLDIVVDMTRENLQRLIDAMRALNLTPRVPVPPEDLLIPEKVRVMIEEKNMAAFAFTNLKNPFQQIDILVLEKWDEISSGAEVQDVGGFKIKIASKEVLIEMKKRAGREKDRLDIEALQRLVEKGKK